MWNVVNDVINPNKSVSWKIKTEQGTLEEETEIANAFNQFFIDKVQKLKEGIDHNNVKNPLKNLAKKWSRKN